MEFLPCEVCGKRLYEDELYLYMDEDEDTGFVCELCARLYKWYYLEAPDDTIIIESATPLFWDGD